MALAAYATTANLFKVLIGVASYVGTAKDGLPLQLNPTYSLPRAYDELAAICNRVQEQLVGDNPQVNTAQEELTLVPGTLAYDIPEDLLRAEIVSIKYRDTNGILQGFPIYYCSPKDFALLWGPWQNSVGITLFPRNYTLTPDMTQIKFTGFTQGGVYVVEYRTKPAAWTGDDVNDEDSTVVSSIPDTFLDVLQLLIAEQILVRLGKLDRLQIVRNELYVPKGHTKKSRFDECVYDLAFVGSSHEQQYWSNYRPKTAGTPLRYGGANYGGRGRRAGRGANW